MLPIIRHHHEKLDGSGYPDGLEDDQIPLTARVLQTVDIYEALTTERLSESQFVRRGFPHPARWSETRLVERSAG